MKGSSKMLAELRRRYEFKGIETEEFRRLCAEFMPPGSTDAKLENFFDQWVYGTGVPTLKLSYSVKGKPGAYKLTGTVSQSDAGRGFQRGGAGGDSDRAWETGCPAGADEFGRSGVVLV